MDCHRFAFSGQKFGYRVDRKKALLDPEINPIREDRVDKAMGIADTDETFACVIVNAIRKVV